MNVLCQTDAALPKDGVYEWHGDAIRNITGGIHVSDENSSGSTGMLWGIDSGKPTGNGALVPSEVNCPSVVTYRNDTPGYGLAFDALRAVPIAHENRPRAGMLPGCVYVGR